MATNTTTGLGGEQAQDGRGEERINQLRAQVDDVREVMTANVERVLARGERLEDLLDKSEDLESGASGFRASARRVERHMCWRNMKCNCIIAAIVFVILCVVLIVILYETGAFKSTGGGGSRIIITTSTSTTTTTTTTTPKM